MVIIILKAAFYGQFDVLKLLSKLYKNIEKIDTEDVHNETPLMLACIRGYEKVQQKIVDIN